MAVAIFALVGFGLSYSELRGLRQRFDKVSHHTFHDHMEVREFMISVALTGADHPIVVLGDSITEMERLPELIGGHPVINAGIGGATIGDFVGIAPKILAGVEPSLCVVALGANDALGSNGAAGEIYSALLAELKPICPDLLAFGVSPLEGSGFINDQIRTAARSAGIRFAETAVPAGATLPDHVHPNAAGRAAWTTGLITAITAPLS
jgi:lysophospholipase L1-like esterase